MAVNKHLGKFINDVQVILMEAVIYSSFADVGTPWTLAIHDHGGRTQSAWHQNYTYMRHPLLQYY